MTPCLLFKSRKRLLNAAVLASGFTLFVVACSDSDGETVAVTPTDDGTGGDSGGDTTTCSITTADAGNDVIGAAGGSVSLAATFEETTAGCASVSWTQTAGPAASIQSQTSLSTVVTLPDVTTSQTLVFEVTGDDGAGGARSDTVSVGVLVPATTTAGLTELGDFSERDDWACDAAPPAATTVSFSDQGTQTVISGNGIPDHATGTFPNSGNPNTISTQSAMYTITNSPAVTATATQMAEFGVTVDGVKLERDTAESYQNAGAWRYEAITAGLAGERTALAEFDWLGTDCSNGHVQPTGAYHYHGFMEGLYQRLNDGDVAVASDMILGGYAADGFPFYLRYAYADPSDASSGLAVMEGSWELLSGTRPNGPGGAYDGTFREDWQYVAASGDLDECNGRTGVTPEFPGGTYYYVITDDYPFIPRCVFGTPDSSFRRGR
ncbi:MAG: YHYH protein [Pseudomonadota bacterium]